MRRITSRDETAARQSWLLKDLSAVRDEAADHGRERVVLADEESGVGRPATLNVMHRQLWNVVRLAGSGRPPSTRSKLR
jgi:hypothetical protein